MQFTTTPLKEPQRGSFYENLNYSENSVVISSVLESSFGKEIRILFQKGQMMKEHQTKYPITVMTLKGSIEFRIKEKTYILNEGDIIALEGGVLHELQALKDSIVWLSLHKQDSVERVQQILTA